MSGINHLKIKEELLNRIRNADIISTTLRGVTTQSDSFNGDDSNKDFTLTKSGIKNIRSVVVGGVTLTPLKDYTYTLTEADSINKIVSLEVAPEVGVENVVITYDYSNSGDLIYDDFNMYTIKSEDKFPRIAFDIVSESSRDKALQGAIYQSNLIIVFNVFGRGKNETEEIIESLSSLINTIKLDLVRLNYIAYRGKTRLDVWIDGKTYKIYKKGLNYSAPYEFLI